VGNLKTNIACTEKAKRFLTQVYRFMLMLTLKVKVTLLELQFLDPSYIEVCLVGYMTNFFDVRYGNAIVHSSQKSLMVINHLKGMSGVSKRVSGQDLRNTGWSNVQLLDYDHRAFVVAKTLSNSKSSVKEGSQLCYRGKRNLFGRWTDIHTSYTRFYSTQSFLEDEFKMCATITEEFLTFQKKCVNWKGPIKDHIYNFLLDPRLFQIAYRNLLDNSSNIHSRINKTVLNKLSEKCIKEIISLLKNETFKFTPVQIINISKSKSGTHPIITVASFIDKILMEMMRMIIEAVFEPRFFSHSHGFRPGRNCNTAFKQIKEQFSASSWYIQIDLFKDFDSIDHHKLMILVESVIKDRKFTRLIWKSLRIGYFDFRKYQTSIISTAQDFILSPIFFNIYTHNFDLFIEELQKNYKRLNLHLKKKNLSSSKKENQKLYPKMQLFPFIFPIDPNSRRLVYVRYMCDCLIGFLGTYSESIDLKILIEDFLKKQMGLYLDKKKFSITHAETGKIIFLGTYIFKSRVQKLNRNDKNHTFQNFSSIRLEAPMKQILNQLTKANFVRNNISWPKFIWLHCSLEQIVIKYNSILSGYMNFYLFIDNRVYMATYLYYLLRGSCAKLIAAKMKLSSQVQVYAKYGKSLTVNKKSGLSFQKPTNI